MNLHRDISSKEDKSRIKDLIVGDSFKKDVSKGLYIGASLDLVSENDEDKYIPKPRYIPWGDLSGHLAVYGTTRVGKTRLMISMVDQVIEVGHNVLIVEPKGSVGGKDDEGNFTGGGQEVLAWVLESAERHGKLRWVKYISPAFPDQSLCLNPIYTQKDEETASLIAQMVPAKDEFFKIMGYQTSYSILLGLRFLEAAEGRDIAQKAIKSEYERVYSGGIEGMVDEERKIASPDLAERIHRPLCSKLTEAHIPPFRSLATFEDIERYMSHEGIKELYELVSAVTEDQLIVSSEKEKENVMLLKRQAETVLRRMATKDPTYYSKVSSSFETLFSQLAKGDIGKVFCSVKINPLMDSLLHPTMGVIAVIQPFPLTYGLAADIFVRTFFSMLTSLSGRIGASGRPAPRRTSMFVDEGGAVLFPGVEHLFNKGGGLGMSLFIFTQSFSDYKAGLGEDLAEIVNDNTNIKIFMRMNDPQSRETVSKIFGKYKSFDSSYMGSKLDMRINTREEEKDILLPSHIGDMEKQDFLLQYGEGRFYCTAPYQEDPSLYIKMPELDGEKIARQGREYIDSMLSFTDEDGAEPISEDMLENLKKELNDFVIDEGFEKDVLKKQKKKAE